MLYLCGAAFNDYGLIPNERKSVSMNRRIGILSVFMSAFMMISCLSAPQVSAAEMQNAISLTPEEEEYVAAHSVIRVGYVQDRIPVSFSNDDGEFDGISRHILERISRLSGFEFEYIPLPSGDVTYDYLINGGFDLVTSVEYNEENKKARGILISEPYLSSRKVVVAKDNLDFRSDGSWTVAVSTGSQTLKKVLAASFPNFEIKDCETITDCFDAVTDGTADLVIQNQFVVEYWLSKPKYENLKVIPVMGMDDQLCFSAVVPFGEESEEEQKQGQILIDILDKAISCISEDEAASYIIQGVMENQYKYTLSDFVSRYRYSFIMVIVALIIITLLAILLFRLRIRFIKSKADANAKGMFLSSMSHEIRTPLNGLIGLNYLMTQKLDDKEKMKEYLGQSSVTAKYLLSLVNDILDSSKLEANKLELADQPVDIGLVIETVSAIEKSAMNDKKLKYTFRSEISYPYVMGDDMRIQQVLLNILDNARKFTSEGGSVDLYLKQEMTKNNKVLTSVTITDTGKGMSEEFQKHIFDLFAQELETVSKGNKGTGLGLSISRRLALLMGGDLTCESKKGKGSSFTFTFVGAPASAPAKAQRTELSVSGERPRILVAEDNELNGEIMLELLHGDGLEADLAENGRIALEMFKNSPVGTYGVILMDLLMPELDGFEASEAIRALDRGDAKTVRIFACTANSFAEDREKALASGMDDFIAKPVNIEELLKKI